MSVLWRHERPHDAPDSPLQRQAANHVTARQPINNEGGNVGYLRPTAIIVGASYSAKHDVGRDSHWIQIAHGEALRVFGDRGMEQLVSPVIGGMTNDERSFYIAWDGSKEGWETSDEADSARGEFVEWLRAQRYHDGSSPLGWVEVQFGGDDREAVALNHNGDRQAIA
jgi:hypothetical protein